MLCASCQVWGKYTPLWRIPLSGSHLPDVWRTVLKTGPSTARMFVKQKHLQKVLYIHYVVLKVQNCSTARLKAAHAGNEHTTYVELLTFIVITERVISSIDSVI
jgi:hypothetical protein